MPLFNYRCSKCGTYAEYLISTAKKHPSNCSCCGEKDSLERLLINRFNLGSSSNALTSKKFDTEKAYESEAAKLKACGGREILEVIYRTPDSINIHHIWATPQAGNN